jgi:autoinducer-2 kinase
VIAGGADTQRALLGSGSVEPGSLTLVGGSFWQTAIVSGQPVIDPEFRVRTLCYAMLATWMMEGIGFLNGLAIGRGWAQYFVMAFGRDNA